MIAGLFGGLTVSRKILFVQALPAMVALVVLIAWAMSKGTAAPISSDQSGDPSGRCRSRNQARAELLA